MKKIILLTILVLSLVACDEHKSRSSQSTVLNELNENTKIQFWFDDKKIMKSFKSSLTVAKIKYTVDRNGIVSYLHKDKKAVKVIGDHIFACHYNPSKAKCLTN